MNHHTNNQNGIMKKIPPITTKGTALEIAYIGGLNMSKSPKYMKMKSSKAINEINRTNKIKTKNINRAISLPFTVSISDMMPIIPP
jgi:hypothetical protein